MSKIFFAILLYTVVCQPEVAFSEWNMMYHFADLDRQFPYVPKLELSHEGRIKDTIRVINEIQADASCFVEWNGNELNPYHIASAEVLVKQFQRVVAEAKSRPGLTADEKMKKFLEKAEAGINAAVANFDFKALEGVIAEKIKSPHPGISGEALDLVYELADRVRTLTQVRNIYFYKDPSNYLTKIVQKKSGDVYDANGKTGQTFAPKEASDGKTPMQSILMVINKQKFEEVAKDVFHVFTDVPDVAGTANTQNFVVKPLLVKGTNIRVDLICTHFKSKEDGFLSRMKLARTISHYVRRERSTNPQINFVLMGDLNTEISELAFDFEANILRFTPHVKLPATDFTPKTVFIPRSEMQNVRRLLDKDDARLMALNKYKRELEAGKKSSDKIPAFESSRKQLDAVFAELQKSPAIDLNRPLWIEFSNFPTQRKIRVAEIDYSERHYQTAKANFMSANPDLKQIVDRAVSKLRLQQENTRNSQSLVQVFDEADERQAVEAKAFGEIISWIRLKMAQRNVVATLKNWWQANDKKYNEFKASTSKSWLLASNPMEFYLKVLVESLLKSSKIDFVMAHLYNMVDLIETRSTASFNDELTFGVPSKEFPSDHLPVFVRLRFLPEVFNPDNFIGRPAETQTIVNEVDDLYKKATQKRML